MYFRKYPLFAQDQDAGGGDGAAAAAVEMNGGKPADPQDKNNEALADPKVEGLMGEGVAEDDAEKKAEGEEEAAPLGDRPEDIPEQFWDKEKKAVKAEAMGKSYKDLRNELNKLKQEGKKDPKALEKPEEFLEDYEAPKTFKDEKGTDQDLYRIGNIEKNDPALKVFAEAAAKAKLTKEQFNIIVPEFLGGIHEFLPEPFDRDAEIENLGGDDLAGPLIKINQGWLTHLHKNGVFNEDQFKYSLIFGETAIGVEVLNAIRVNSGEKPIPTGASVNTGIKTADELQAMMEDPRYGKETAEGKAYQEEVDAEFKKTHGEGKGQAIS